MQVYLRPKIFLLGSSLAFSIKEDHVRCAKVCNKSWVILLIRCPWIIENLGGHFMLFNAILYSIRTGDYHSSVVFFHLFHSPTYNLAMGCQRCDFVLQSTLNCLNMKWKLVEHVG